MRRRVLQFVAAIAPLCLQLNGCSLSGLGWEYLPYVNQDGAGGYYFDKHAYEQDHDDDDGQEWYCWPLDC